MDFKSEDFLPEENSVAEAPESFVAEQRPENIAPCCEAFHEVMQTDCESVPEQELYTEPNREPPVSRPVDNRTPYGNPEQGYPYGAVPNAAYDYPPKGNPYQQGYYRSAPYGQTYVPGQAPYYGGNYVPLNREAAYTPPAPYAHPKPVVQKNNKPVGALVLGILAMGILNFMPFVALVLSIIALCTGYTGLRQGELTKGKRICGYFGLALGIIGLILSVTMLSMLLALIIRASKEVSGSVNSIYR